MKYAPKNEPMAAATSSAVDSGIVTWGIRRRILVSRVFWKMKIRARTASSRTATRRDQPVHQRPGAVGRDVVELGEQDEPVGGIAGVLGPRGLRGDDPERGPGRADDIGGAGERFAGPAEVGALGVVRRRVRQPAER